LPNAEAAGRWLKLNLRKGDLVLVKGSRGVHLERVIEGLHGCGNPAKFACKRILPPSGLVKLT